MGEGAGRAVALALFPRYLAFTVRESREETKVVCKRKEESPCGGGTRAAGLADDRMATQSYRTEVSGNRCRFAVRQTRTVSPWYISISPKFLLTVGTRVLGLRRIAYAATRKLGRTLVA